MFRVCLCVFTIFLFLMIRRPPRATRTDTLFPYTTLFRSFDLGIGILRFDSGEGMRRAFFPDEKRIALRIVARAFGFGSDPHQPAKHVAAAPRRYSLDRKSTRLNSSH